MKGRTTIFFLLFLLGYQIAFTQKSDSEEITITELHDHIAFLASDSLKGRKPGTVEGRLAAEYIKKCLVANGATFLGDQGFQYFKVVTSVKMGERNRLSFAQFDGVPGKDFTPLSFSGNGTFSGAITFAGYGFDFESDTISWHDYEGLDVTGKWVLVLRGDPEIDNSNSVFIPFSSPRKKVLVAKDKGAMGVILVSGVNVDQNDDLLDLSFDFSQTDTGIPVLHLKRDVANQLLAKSNRSIEDMEEQLNQSRKPNSMDIDLRVTASIEIFKNEVTTQNVVGMITGSDLRLRDEFIVMGAHYDHLGLGGPGSGSRQPDTTAVHNGADDNGSGVASILEIFEKLAVRRSILKRSVLLVAFGAEEMGTIGSKYFTENPLIDLKKTILMINLDMVGRLDSETRALSIGGSGTAIGFEEMVDPIVDKHGLKANYAPEGYGPSDHASFYAKDIPVLSFMTSMHGDYHTPQDDIEMINLEGQKIVSDLIYSIVVHLANRDETLVFQEAGPKTRQSMRRRFKVTLGIMPDVAATDIKGLRANVVIPDRPAAQAGMKKGDIIVAMEGKSVNDIYEYMHRLSDFQPGQRISIEVIRDGEKVILIVEL